MSNEQPSKRLDHLQSVINRMADNSFKLKGLCVTLVSGMLSLALKNGPGDASTALIAFLGVLPTLIFWLLDGYYLALERGFRAMYNQTAEQTAGAQPINAPVITLRASLGAACSAVTLALYGALLAIEALVGFGGLSAIVAKIH